MDAQFHFFSLYLLFFNFIVLMIDFKIIVQQELFQTTENQDSHLLEFNYKMLVVIVVLIRILANKAQDYNNKNNIPLL